MNFLRLQEVIVQKIHPKGAATGVNPKSPLSFDFKKRYWVKCSVHILRGPLAVWQYRLWSFTLWLVNLNFPQELVPSNHMFLCENRLFFVVPLCQCFPKKIYTEFLIRTCYLLKYFKIRFESQNLSFSKPCHYSIF